MKNIRSQFESLEKYVRRVGQNLLSHRQFLLFGALGLALSAELWLILNDLPKHGTLVKHISVITCALILPFTIAAITTRLPFFRQKIKRRFIIRPFGALSSSPAHDGKTIASLLFRSLAVIQSQSSGALEAGRTGIKIAVGGTSFSLDLLWPVVRNVLTGKKDLIIDGLLLDSADGFQLRIWIEGTSETWMEPLNEGSFTEGLDQAVRKMAANIFERLEPIFWAGIRNMQWNYEEAIRIMSAENPRDDGNLLIETAQMGLNGGYLAYAERQIGTLKKKRWLGDDHRLTLSSLEATLYMLRGEFGEGRKRLLAAINDAKCTPSRSASLWYSTAESLMYEGQFLDATEIYDKALAIASKELSNVGEVGTWHEVANKLYEEKQKGQVIANLSQLFDIYTSRARSRKLAGLDPIEDLNDSVNIVEVLLNIDSAFQNEWEYRQALALAEVARFHYERIPGFATEMTQIERDTYAQTKDLFEESNERALYLFEMGIQSFDSPALSPEEFGELVDLAWRYYRKTSCSLLKKSLIRVEDQELRRLNIAAARLTDIFVSLPEPVRIKLTRLLSRTSQLGPEKGKKYLARLRQLTESYLEAVVAAYSYDDLAVLLDDLENISVDNSSQEISVMEGWAPKLSDVAESRWKEGGFDLDDLSFLYSRLELLLHTVASERDQSSLNQLLQSVAVEHDAIRALDKSDALFRRLISSRPKRVKAEGHYGLACIAAITNDASAALEYLRRARAVAGEQTFMYTNRARIDQDFDDIRSQEFLRNVEGNPVAPAKT